VHGVEKWYRFEENGTWEGSSGPAGSSPSIRVAPGEPKAPHTDARTKWRIVNVWLAVEGANFTFTVDALFSRLLSNSPSNRICIKQPELPGLVHNKCWELFILDLAEEIQVGSRRASAFQPSPQF
jgi:hypothetical protein